MGFGDGKGKEAKSQTWNRWSDRENTDNVVAEIVFDSFFFIFYISTHTYEQALVYVPEKLFNHLGINGNTFFLFVCRSTTDEHFFN